MSKTVGRSAWSSGAIRYAGEFRFPVPIEVFWQTIESFDRYPQWWPWLHDFSTDTDGLVDGNVLRGTVVPPIPYRFHLQVRLHSCERLSVTKAVLGGDLGGWATMHFDEVDGATRVRVEWTLEMLSTPMRIAARVARPLVLWGHDRVVEMAVAGITRRLPSATTDESCGRRPSEPVRADGAPSARARRERS